jgi:hypothetical protein
MGSRRSCGACDTRRPPIIVQAICRVLRMSANGLARSNTRSARRPASITPMSERRRARAAFSPVIRRITPDENPASASSSSSWRRLSPGITQELVRSVPVVSRQPPSLSDHEDRGARMRLGCSSVEDRDIRDDRRERIRSGSQNGRRETGRDSCNFERDQASITSQRAHADLNRAPG